MKILATQCMAAVAIVFAMSGFAVAGDNGDEQKACSDQTLRGLYVFTASGFNIVGTAALPKAIVELINFNGDGTATGERTTVSVNGTIRYSSGTPGTYTLDPDCTGHLKFMDGGPNPQFDLFAAFQGSQIQMIQTFQEAFAGLPVFQGTAERVSR